MHNNQDDELSPLFAAGNPYAGGNSKAARSARARAQRRDNKGRFAYMGGGFKTPVRKDGKTYGLLGRAVGASNREGYIQVMIPEGDPVFPAGVYDIPSQNGEGSIVILPGSSASAPWDGSESDPNIVNFEDLVRRDAPEDWVKNDDGSFTTLDGEWTAAPTENGKWSLSQNGKALPDTYRDAATAITRATALDIEETADEDTKTRVATLRSEGADQDAIDKVLFNAEDEEDGEAQATTARASDDVRAELNDAKERFEAAETELNSINEEENPERVDELLEEMRSLAEEIDALDAEYKQAVRAEQPAEPSGQARPDTVESLTRRIDRLEADAQRRLDRGQDTDDIDQEIADLEQKRQALIDAGEKDGGEAAPPSDGGGEGTVPDELGGEDARGPRVERRGDTLRDSDGNVIAQKVSEPLNAEDIRENGYRVAELFEVDPEYAGLYREALIEAMKDHPQGASVTVHDEDYYRQPGVRMFLTQDGKGGITLNGDEIVTGFMARDAADANGGAIHSMISKMVELGGRRLDAFDTKLPQLYARNGFRPVARVRWNDDYAPTVEGGAARDWDKADYDKYNNGEPDVVFMVYEPDRLWSEYNPEEGEYVDEYDQGVEIQKAAVEATTQEAVTQELTDRQKAAQARRQATQEQLNELAGEDGLLQGDVPQNARGGVSNQALQLAPIGQVVEATSRNGRKRRFIKVGKDTWKRTDKPDDKKRYRSHELRGGSAQFVERTEADVPSADEVRGPVDRYRPKPFSFPRNATDEELTRLREIYQIQADTDDNVGGSLRAAETVRLIDMTLARRKGEPIARLRPAAERRAQDLREGRPTEALNVPARRRRANAPLLKRNEVTDNMGAEAHTVENNLGEGTSDDPQVLADMFDSADLKRAFISSILAGNDSVAMEFPGIDGEDGPRANVPLEAIRDALQLQGIDTNLLIEDIRDELDAVRGEDAAGRPISERGPEDEVTRSQFLDGLYQQIHDHETAIAYANAIGRPAEEVARLMDQRNGFARAISRLELMGFRSTNAVEEIDLDNFKWDDNSPDIYDPDLIMDAMRRKYPDATVLPNGDLLIGSNEDVDRDGNRFRYDVIVTKTEDETYYTYIRETNLAAQGEPGSVKSMRVGVMRQSAHALNNQALMALSKVMKTDRRVRNVNNWFNNTADRSDQGMYAKVDEFDENGEPVHEKQRVFTYEAIRKIQEAVDDERITEEMMNTLYNYVLNVGNGEEVAATLYESFGLDIETMNRLIDAINENIDNRRLDEVRAFSKWQTENGIPLAEGDIVEYVGKEDQPGYERLNGRRGEVRIRRLEHTVTDRLGVKRTYTDMVYVKLMDENGNFTNEEYAIIPAKHLGIVKTAAGTDGSERKGEFGMQVPAPALTRRALNRYAGRRRLRDVAPYVSEYDRNSLESPKVTIDGVEYPVTFSRSQLIPENVDKIAATAGDLQVGDLIKTFEDIDGYPTARLNEVVGIEELEDGSRLVHTVMPLDLFSGRVASTQYDADDSLALEVYREKDVEETPVDMNAPGLTSNQVALLAEAAHRANMSQVDPETRARVREIVGSTTPEDLPYTPLQYADIFRELLEAENTGTIGAVSPEEAARVMENIVRRGGPTPDAASGMLSVSRAGRQRSAQLNNNTPRESERQVLSRQAASVSHQAFINNVLQRGPYEAGAGISPLDAQQFREALANSDVDAIREVVDSVYMNRVFGDKFSIDINSVEPYGRNGIIWTGRLVDPTDARQVGVVERTISTDRQGIMSVYHQLLWIHEKSDRRTGFSTQFKDISDEFYKSIGVDKIGISTASDGGYAWGKANYTWADEAAARTIKNRLVTALGRQSSLDDPDAKILQDMLRRFEKDFLDPDFPDPIDIANLQRSDGSNWGRDLMTNSNWSGVRYLNTDLDPRPQNRKDKGKKGAEVDEGKKQTAALTSPEQVEAVETDRANAEQQAEETANPDVADALAEEAQQDAEAIEAAPVPVPRAPREPSIGAFTGKLADLLDGVTDPKEVQDIINGQDIAYIDFETTGFSSVPGDGALNRPLQMGIVIVRDGKVVDRRNIWMNPETLLSQWSKDNLEDADGNPLTDEWLAQQSTMKEALQEAADFMGPNAILGGQNVQFDLEVLTRNLREQGIDFSFAGTLDSRDLAKKSLPTWTPENPVGPSKIDDRTGERVASNSLGDLVKFLQEEGYDVKLENWHSADADAEASHEVIQALLQRAVDNNVDLGVLTNKPERDRASAEEWTAYTEQYNAYREQLSEYFDATEDADKDARMELATPLTPESYGVNYEAAPTEETENENTSEYFGSDGVLTSGKWIDDAPDGSVLEYTTDFGEVRLYRKTDGQWYPLTYNMAVDGVPNPEDNTPTGYLKSIAERRGQDGSSIREVSADPEAFKKYDDFANGTLSEANVDEMSVIEAINNKDGFAIADIFIQKLFGNGERQFGDFFIKNAQVTPGVYTTTGEPKMTITASIVNSDGEEVGTIVRVLKQNRDGDIRVVHSLMKIYEDENKGTGFSSQFSAASEELYERLNVAEIETFTAWDGSYVWARAQYDWNFEDFSVNEALGKVPDALDEALEEAIMDNRVQDANAISDIIERMAGLDSDDPNYPTPYEISSLESQDPNIKLGRQILTDSKWQGIKRLPRNNSSGGGADNG